MNRITLAAVFLSASLAHSLFGTEDKEKWKLEPRQNDWSFKTEKKDWKFKNPNNNWELDKKLRKQKTALDRSQQAAPKAPVSKFDRVSIGMFAEDVGQLLGSPTTKSAEFWTYSEGYLEFSASNRVSRIRKSESTPSSNRVVASVTGLNPSSADDYLAYFQQAYPPDVIISQYQKQDGTVVEAHHRTAPNSTRNDNYNARGNINPYTGKEGYQPRDGE